MAPLCLDILNIQLHKVATPIKLPLENIVNMSPRQSHQMYTPALRAWASLVDALSQYDWETLRTAESLIELAHLNGDTKLFLQLLNIWDACSWVSWAIQSGSLQTVKALARLGVISMEREGPDMLHKALEGHHVEIAKYLIEARVDVNAKNNEGQTPLHRALHCRNCLIMIKPRANVNAVDNEGRMPGHMAASWSLSEHSAEALQVLIKAGADVNAKDKEGKTPLHAVNTYPGGGSLWCSQCLIDAGADVNAEDPGGRTPLHAAAECHSNEVAKLLIKSGANVNIMDKAKNMPLHLAVSDVRARATSSKDGLKAAKELIASRADVNAADHEGNMPLHILLQQWFETPVEEVEILQTLIEAGADVKAKNRSGSTPWSIALFTSKDNSILELLRQSGADGQAVNGV